MLPFVVSTGFIVATSNADCGNTVGTRQTIAAAGNQQVDRTARIIGQRDPPIHPSGRIYSQFRHNCSDFAILKLSSLYYVGSRIALFKWLRRSKFSPLERELLEAVASSLEPAAASLFRAQLAEVNLVQRHARKKEVNCYVKHSGSLRRNPQLQFPNQTLEARLATVTFHAARLQKKVRAELFLVKGFFFSILFSASPKEIGMPLSIDQVTVHTDPMERRSDGGGARQVVSAPFTGYLADWQRQFKIDSAYAPLSSAEQADRLAAIHTTLPSDYLELTRQCDGMDIADISVLGLSQIRELAGNEANYYLVAEMTDARALGVRCDSSDGAVALLSHDERPEYFPNFRSAMEFQLNHRRNT